MKSSDLKHPAPILYQICRYIGLAISKVFWRVTFTGTENIPKSGGVLIASNHQTYVDPVWIAAPMKRKCRFMAWDEAFDWFFVGKLMRRLGAFPIRTVGDGGKLDAMKNALKFLRGGEMLVIFPEGERCFADGKMLEFKPGALRIAMEAGVPVMPVTIRGGNEVWARGQKYPKRGKVEIVFHPPFTIEKPKKKSDLDEYVENLNKKLAGMIEMN